MTNPPRRTRFIGLLNGSMRAARKVGMADPPLLDRKSLMARASETTGLDDFGDEWFIEPFDRLLEALHGEARLNAAGEWAAMKQFDKVL